MWQRQQNSLQNGIGCVFISLFAIGNMIYGPTWFDKRNIPISNWSNIEFVETNFRYLGN